MPSAVLRSTTVIYPTFRTRFAPMAVDSGSWRLYRYDPALKAQGKSPLSLGCKEPSVDIEEYMYREMRFRSLRDAHPDRAEKFPVRVWIDAKEKYDYFEYLADLGLLLPPILT